MLLRKPEQGRLKNKYIWTLLQTLKQMFYGNPVGHKFYLFCRKERFTISMCNKESNKIFGRLFLLKVNFDLTRGVFFITYEVKTEVSKYRIITRHVYRSNIYLIFPFTFQVFSNYFVKQKLEVCLETTLTCYKNAFTASFVI